MIIGIDVGGTKVNGLVIDPDTGTIVARDRAPSAGSAPELAQTIVSVIERLGRAVSGPVRGVGLGVAGLAQTSGVVRYSPNLPALVEYPLGSTIEQEVGLPVHVFNDATAGAWAEARFGAGRGLSDFAYIALGTGIGAGFVVGGRLLLGAHGFAGEAGHMVVDRHGPTHITGQRGPWEYDSSGTGLGRMGREAARAGHFATGIADAGSVDEITGQHVARAVAGGDPQGEAILDAFAANVAVGAANLVLILDPQRLIIGGGLADIGEPLRAAVEHSLRRQLLGVDHRPFVAVAIAHLGSDASALGAGLIAARQLDREAPDEIFPAD